MSLTFWRSHFSFRCVKPCWMNLFHKGRQSLPKHYNSLWITAKNPHICLVFWSRAGEVFCCWIDFESWMCLNLLCFTIQKHNNAFTFFLILVQSFLSYQWLLALVVSSVLSLLPVFLKGTSILLRIKFFFLVFFYFWPVLQSLPCCYRCTLPLFLFLFVSVLKSSLLYPRLLHHRFYVHLRVSFDRDYPTIVPVYPLFRSFEVSHVNFSVILPWFASYSRKRFPCFLTVFAVSTSFLSLHLVYLSSGCICY